MASPKEKRATTTETPPAKIAVLGGGWWSQGWHIPQLHRNPNAELVAIVDPNPHPQSNLNPNLEPLTVLAQKYDTRIFASFEELLQDEQVGPTVQGVIVCTPHATHSAIGQEILQENIKRLASQQQAPIHILMEKPFTTRLDHAHELHQAVSQDVFAQSVYFSINHSGNYRPQAKKARELVASGAIGHLRFVHVFFASPLCSIFEDAANKGWNEPSEGMLGNGFAWGQSSHVLAWIFHVYPSLRPETVYCNMTHSPTTGADVAHTASIRCRDESVTDESVDNVVVFSLSGTSLLPGDAHSEPPVGKHIQLGLYGSKGSLLYSGMDLDSASGSLELRDMSTGNTEHPAGEGFLFEDLDTSGIGPESIQSLIQACRQGPSGAYVGASSAVGLRTVQVLDAMYRSHKERKEVDVV